MALEERMAHLEGTVSQMNERLASLEKMLLDRLAASDKRMDRLETRMEANFRWTLGILLPMWMTIIIAIFLK